MGYKYTTPVPNLVFDTFLPTLNKAELKLLLIIIRQTNGWVDFKTGRRKTFDWIALSQFMKKTGLAERTISLSLDSLVSKGVIEIRSSQRKVLSKPQQRQGQKRLFYGLTPIMNGFAIPQKNTQTSAKKYG